MQTLNSPVLARYGTERGNEMEGGRGDDLFFGLGGNDELDGEGGSDTLHGGAGRDEIDGGSGNDRLYGGTDNDTLDGGRGNDTLTGGAGRDIFEFERGEGRDTFTDFTNGEDRIDLDDFTTAAVQSVIEGARQVGNDVVLTISANDSITLQNFRLADLDFSDFADVRPPVTPVTPPPERGRDINGTAADNVLTGGAGNDDIEGRSGNDLIDGGAGHDEIDGGSGRDTLRGGEGNDEIDGGSSADRLEGGNGNDTLEGGRGNDVMTGGAGRDVFEIDRGDGNDTITDFTNGQDRIDLDDFTTAGVQSVIDTARQVGNDVVLTVSATDSVTLQNFRLADLDVSDFTGMRAPTAPVTPAPDRGRDINGTSADNVLTGGAGNDDIEGRSGNDLIDGGAGHDEIDGGSGRDTLRGGEGNDELDGGSSADRLEGGNGNDTLEGGRGNDLLSGGLGNDVFEFERGDGNDTITDFTNGQDRIDLDDFTVWQVQSVIDGAQQVGSDVVLTLAPDTSVTLQNVQLAQLDMADFLL